MTKYLVIVYDDTNKSWIVNYMRGFLEQHGTVTNGEAYYTVADVAENCSNVTVLDTRDLEDEEETE